MEVKEKNKKFYGVKDIAEMLDLTTITVSRWCRSGFLPAVKIGQQWKISVEDFNAWLKQQVEAQK